MPRYNDRLGRRINDHHRRQHEHPPLDEHLTPISSGMDPAPANAGRLSKERRTALDDALEALTDARTHAAVASRTYMVRGD